MSPLYLRYRNVSTDPWTVPPPLASSFPGLPAGALPLETMKLATGPQTLTPCGCSSSDPYVEDHCGMHSGLSAMPQSAMPAVTTFLLQFKQAAFHEAMHSLYGSGAFVSAELSQLAVRNDGGRSAVSFRIASNITDII